VDGASKQTLARSRLSDDQDRQVGSRGVSVRGSDRFIGATSARLRMIPQPPGVPVQVRAT